MKNKEELRVVGARVHNLKDVSVNIPKQKFVVFTGLSGSGKSSLVFDTIHAEGQRRYLESVSQYASQFFGLLEKADVDQIEGLCPTIAIEQKVLSKNPRSTVGTVSEMYDLLRLLFAKVGQVYCPHGHGIMKAHTWNEILKAVKKMAEVSDDLVLLAPLSHLKQVPFSVLKDQLLAEGFLQISVDGKIMALADVGETPGAYAAVFQIESWSRLGSVKQSAWLTKMLNVSDGVLDVYSPSQKKTQHFFLHPTCLVCGHQMRSISPSLFSFNNPVGACPDCKGLGTQWRVDPVLVFPNKKLSVAEGGIRPWVRVMTQGWYKDILEAVAKSCGFSLRVPISSLTPEDMDVLLYGTGQKTYDVEYPKKTFPGIISDLQEKFEKSQTEYAHREYQQYMREQSCVRCKGKRLKEEVLSIKVGDHDIMDVCACSIEGFVSWLEKDVQDLDKTKKQIVIPLLGEIKKRQEALMQVGLSYLTLDRSAVTLSGGELQRLRLSNQLQYGLSGVIYVLDEPSAGLHALETGALINTIQKLRDQGNSVFVVEHDRDVIESADHIIDMGPKAGLLGGEVVAQGSLEDIRKEKKSSTGRYLLGQKKLMRVGKPSKAKSHFLTIVGAKEHNLQNVTVSFPLGKLVCVTGVSGSGKSTLMHDVLAKALLKHFYRAKEAPGVYERLEGLEHLDKVIVMDQSPIGRTPRSNPATYTGIFTIIRDLFSELPESKIKGYTPGHFSFNVKDGGRCEVCQGEGMIPLDMQFLAEVYVTCESCLGTRYQPFVLEILYKNKHIADVLSMSVSEAKKFFSHIPALYEKLQMLEDVGLGYMKLGQSATTVSGGEAQRIKLATELARRGTGKTLYILDEPTTGLHFEDVQALLTILNRLVEKGNSVFVIEHNIEFMAHMDYLVDLGPLGGSAGGMVVAMGTPQEVSACPGSATGKYLKAFLQKYE